MPGGRPSSYDPEHCKWAQKLCALGATVRDVADFFAKNPSEDDWLAACLTLIKSDNRGVIADRKAKRSERRREYFSSNHSARIRNSVSARLWAALKGRTDGALFSRLGYSAESLVSHLEDLFRPGMSWMNYGVAWHVDHITPCAAYDLTKPGHFADCWALDNLQPLWASQNMSKGSKHG